MKTSLHLLRRREYGGVAVEFALLLVTILPVLLTAILLFGRYFWHYSVAEKAARDTARFLAAASPAEMKVFGSGGVPPIARLATEIGEKEVAELAPGINPAIVSVYCDGHLCVATGPLPQTVTVWVTMDFEDPLLAELSASFLNGGDRFSIPINTAVTMSYVGN